MAKTHCPKCGTRLTVVPPTYKATHDSRKIIKTHAGKAYCPRGCYSESR